MMDFVFCTDKNYLKGYGVLMLSILRFAPSPAQEQLRFHILSDDLDDADKGLLQGIAARREGTEVAFYEPAKALSEEVLAQIDATLYHYVTRETYYTLLIADLLPADVHRALYLDGDMICTGSLEELFNIDLKDYPVAMCPSASTSKIGTCNRLGYPPQDDYFNLGTMLVNLDIWRKENLTKPMFDYLSLNAKKLLTLSQDLICAVLHGRIMRLDCSYNMTQNNFNVFYWLQEEKNNYYAASTQYLPKSEWPAILAAVESPRIVHTVGGLKFWHRECNNPFTAVWRYFYAASPWAKERLKSYVARLHLKKRLRWHGRRALEKLDLVTPAIPCPKEAYAIAQEVLDKLLAEDRARS